MSEPSEPNSSPGQTALSSHSSDAEIVRPPLQLVRLPVDKPQAAVTFLQSRSRGVMDLIAHFWERLPQTPPLTRHDLHLVVATPIESDNININIPQLDPLLFSGAMLYVPKAHRADVLALDPATAGAFAAYISHQGPRVLRVEQAGAVAAAESGKQVATPKGVEKGEPATLPLADLSAPARGAGGSSVSELPAELPPAVRGSANGAAANNGRIPIDFLTGQSEGIGWMVPLLLPLVHKRVPAKQLVNVVMQLPPEIPVALDANVRLARDSDVPTLNRWRRLYKEERGILFDADMDAWVEGKRVFVYEADQQIVALAKVDLELADLAEIGGVYTFPEFRKRGFGASIVRDMAARIRQAGKVPTLQVDEQNVPALSLYQTAGWQPMGKLARVWLTG